MKLLGTVKEIQELQDKCFVMECDNCILSYSGTCEVYNTKRYIDELISINPDMETTISI